MKKHTKARSGKLLTTSALTSVSLTLGAFVPGGALAADAPGTVEEVLVLGEFIPEVMRETPQVSSVVLPVDLARQGDSTAAAALVRVTGLSVVDGRFVYVRGLGERYSSALLNGSPLPSPEPLQRVVPLDLFPSNILAGVTVQKTYSANYPGEFGGGTIDLETVGVPDEAFLSMSVSGGGTVDTTLEPGLTYFGSRTDWTGFDDGTRDMPEAVIAAIESGRGRINSANFSDAEIQAIGRDFINAPLNLLQEMEKTPGDFGASLSAGDSFPVGSGDLGIVAVAAYDNSWETRRGVQEEGEVGLDGTITPETHYDFVSTQNDITLNGLLGFAYNWANYELQWTNLYVRRVTKEARSREGFSLNTGDDVREDYTEWFERELYDTQGVAYGVFGPLEVEVKGSWAKSRREAPYEKGIRYRLVDGVYQHSANAEFNYTNFSVVDDTVVSGGLDLIYTLPISDLREATISGGYAYMDNDRNAVRRDFRFRAENVSLPIEVQRQRVDFLFSDFNIGPQGLVLTEETDDFSAYDGALRTHGYYAQVDAEIVPLVRVAAGLRYEDSKLGVTLRSVIPNPNPDASPPPSLFEPPPPRENDYWLPTGAVTWNFYEDMQLRLAASKTIARPQFRELAPQPYVDPDSDRLFIGNPYLLDSELLNLDARYEWYLGANEFIALSGFFKKIDNPIEVIVNEVGGSTQRTFINAPTANLFGGELELRSYFDLPFEGEWLGALDLFTAANYTYTHSEVRVEEGDQTYPLTGGGEPEEASVYIQDGSRLQGQSEHILNVQLGVESLDGLQATFLLNYASDRISARGRQLHPDLIVEPGVTLDFTFRKSWMTMSGAEMEFGFEARNLLGTDYKEFQERGETVLNNAYDIGQSFSVSVTRRY